MNVQYYISKNYTEINIENVQFYFDIIIYEKAINKKKNPKRV